MILMKKTKAVVYFRRKREGRTDYLKRLALLKSRLPRLVVRKTNKHIILQVVEYQPDGDKVLCTVSTQHLLKEGWSAPTGNSAAAYLAGLMLAKKCKMDKEVIVDLGLHTHKAGSCIYAAVRGARDGGMNVRASDEVLAGDERLTGEHLSETVRKQFDSFKQKLR